MRPDESGGGRVSVRGTLASRQSVNMWRGAGTHADTWSLRNTDQDRHQFAVLLAEAKVSASSCRIALSTTRTLPTNIARIKAEQAAMMF
jgi:hypothetical protein